MTVPESVVELAAQNYDKQHQDYTKQQEKAIRARLKWEQEQVAADVLRAETQQIADFLNAHHEGEKTFTVAMPEELEEAVKRREAEAKQRRKEDTAAKAEQEARRPKTREVHASKSGKSGDKRPDAGADRQRPQGAPDAFSAAARA